MDQDFKAPQSQPPIVNEESFTPPPQAPAAPQSQPKKKRGGKLVVIFVGLLLVAGAAAGGWWYGTNQAQKESDAKTAELEAKITDLNKKIAVDSAKTEESSDAVVVDQWGIQFESDDPTTKYQISATNQNALLLYTDASKTMGEKCFPESKTIYGVTVTRSTKKLSEADSPYFTLIKQIGNTYYYSSFPDGGCQVPAAMAEFNTVRADLTAVAKTLTQS